MSENLNSMSNDLLNTEITEILWLTDSDDDTTFTDDYSGDTSNDTDNDTDNDHGAKIPRCDHYNRGCYLLYPCCKEYFACRFCHNNEKSSYKLDPKLIHEADRRSVSMVKCRYCLKEQSITSACIDCGKLFGNYYCTICKLLDLDDKGQFHCDECNICRQGGRDNFKHCELCGICVPIDKETNSEHKCSLKIDGDCPICCSPLFDSVLSCSAARCGHWLHNKCLIEYSKFNNRCPLCFKSLSDTHIHNTYIDQQIESTPMPDEYKNSMVDIMCNDCGAKNNVNLHFYGLKCTDCGNYNTRRL
jgi:RING finger and CHY zinc finger domain-containing protein 1